MNIIIICFLAEWVHPCRCRGTTSSVHVSCLQRWIDEKQKGNPSAKVSCPQCGSDYIILYPRPNLIIFILEKCEMAITKCCPLLAAGVLLGSVYWCAVTYGVIVVLQIFGYEKGMEKLENVDPFLLLLGLPIIPIALVAGKMIRWEQNALQLLHRYILSVPKRNTTSTASQQRGWEEFRDPLPATRVFIGALMLPTFAVTVGSWLKPYIPSSWQRALLGGAAFVAVKGLFRIYYQHQQMKRTALRKVKNFPLESTVNTQTDDYDFDDEGPGPSYEAENDYSSSSEHENMD